MSVVRTPFHGLTHRSGYRRHSIKFIVTSVDHGCWIIDLFDAATFVESHVLAQSYTLTSFTVGRPAILDNRTIGNRVTFVQLFVLFVFSIFNPDISPLVRRQPDLAGRVGKDKGSIQ